MKRFIIVFLVGILVLSLVVTSAFAKGGSSNAKGKWGQTQTQPSAISSVLQNQQTVRGVIKEIRSSEYEVTLENNTNIKVGFGPYWYMKKIGLNLKVGDEVVMTGVYYHNMFVPITVTVNGKTYTLRDKDTGRPLWANNNSKN